MVVRQNRVRAQIDQQGIFIDSLVNIDYDGKLISRMSRTHQVALAIHELVYNIVLGSPKFDQISNISVFVRMWTSLLLMDFAAWLPQIELQIEALSMSIGFESYPVPTFVFADRDGRHISGVKDAQAIYGKHKRYQVCYEIGYHERVVLGGVELLVTDFCKRGSDRIGLELDLKKNPHLHSFIKSLKKTKSIYQLEGDPLGSTSGPRHEYMEIELKSLNVTGFWSERL